ncbi:hypothetical protein ABPG75_006706 [Micractinium tetrahymenae]
MASHLRTCSQLDRQIREEAKQRSIFDPQLRRLRSSLRSECEAALLADFRLSQKHDVESLLWKAVFYRPIEEFRRRIKQAEGELRDKTKLAFHAFLEDGKGFYLQLTVNLQQRFGPAGFPQALAAQHLQQMGLAEPEPLPASSRPLDCRASVHRCLVCLGDLSRYQVNAQPAAERDWAECRRFYQLAARALPGGGNAYNQLAVLSSYEGDDLGAAFFYFRALAASSPFPVARENLVTHFEQNRGASQRLAAAAAGAGAAARGMRPASQALKEMRIRFTRLLGMLFTRDALDAFPGLLAAAMADLDDHLQRVRHQSRKAALASAADQQPPVLVQLAACALYAAAHSRAAAAGGGAGAGGPPPAAPSFAAAAQQQLVGTLSLLLLLGLAARLAAAAAAAAAAAKQGLLGTASAVLLLPPLRLLLRWLAAAGPDVLLPPAGLQPRDAAELAAAQKQLWQAAAQLVAALREAAQQGTEAAAPAGGAGDALGGRAAWPVLAEDGQLAGFLPLEAAASSSSGGGGGGDGRAPVGADAAAALDYGDAAAVAARMRCLLSDAARIAAQLDGAMSSSGGGAVRGQPGLAQAVRAFVEAAAPADGMQVEEQVYQPPPQQQQQREQQAQQQRQQQQAPRPQHDLPLPIPLPNQNPGRNPGRPAELPAETPAAMEEEEEGEEVILYAPPARTTPVPAAAGAPRVPQQQQPQQQQPPPQQQQQQQAQTSRGGQVDTDALMEETAQAVAGSVLPDEDRQVSPPPAALAGLQAPAAPTSGTHRPAAAAAPPGQQPAAAAPGLPPQQQPQPLQQPMLPWLLQGATASAQPQPQPLQQQQQQQQQQWELLQGAARPPSMFESLFGGGTSEQPAPQQQEQQAGPVLHQLQHPSDGTAPRGASLAQQTQQAAGLRSLLFGGDLHRTAGLLGIDSQAQPQLALPGQLPGSAPGAAAAAPAAPSALLSGGSAADRWAWMGAFGGAPAAGPAAASTEAQPLPGAAPVQPAAGQPAAPAGLHQAQQPGLRTNNPFVP